MPLPPEAIAEFQTIWREEYVEDLAAEEARLCAEEFLRFVALVVREPLNTDADSPTRAPLAPVDNWR